MGASLLAMTVGQLALMLNVLASSRASPLPQGIYGACKNDFSSLNVGRFRFLMSINCNPAFCPYSPLHIVFEDLKKPICSVWSQNAKHVDLSRV
ncbi:exported hypothetical protein [Pseudomonas brassicacearum]